MSKRLFMSILIIVQIFLIGFIAFVSLNQVKLQRDVYLNPSPYAKKVNKNQIAPVHTFATDAYENLSLYEPSGENNSLKDAKFYGDFDSYNGIENNKDNPQSIDLWINDFNTSQIVVVVNDDFDELQVKLNNEEFIQSQGLRVEYGFNEFIYASGNGSTNFYGIRKPLLVPEKITNNKILNEVYSKRVYIINVAVNSNDKITDGNVNLDFEITGINKTDSSKNYTSNSLIKVDLFPIDYNPQNGEDSKIDFNLFSFPEWASDYYNKSYDDGHPSKMINSNGIEEEIDPLNYNQYIEFNWNKYWGPQFEYLSKNMGMDWFQLNAVDSWNMNWTYELGFKREYHNPWKIKRKSLNFLSWTYTGDFDTSNSQNKDIKFDDIKEGLTIPASDWESFDRYLNLMADAGMKRGMINSLNGAWGTQGKSIDIYNTKTEEYFKVPSSIIDSNGSKDAEGRKYSNWWFEQLKNHMDTEPDWVDKIDLYYYLDEKDPWQTTETNDWLYEIDPEKEYLHFAVSDWERDIDYKKMEKYDHADYVWVYMLDIYNQKNKNFSEFTKRRNSKGLHTGQYSLDADNTFNLARAEPGILGYTQAALYKQDSPNFMKYSLTGWEDGISSWSSDFNDYDFVNMTYISGDTVWAYPKYNNETSEGKQSIMNDEKIEFNPSTRLEQLAVGTKNMQKIDYLINKNGLSKEIINSNVYSGLKLTKKLSRTKFDLNFTDTSIPSPTNTNSFVKKYLKAGKGPDEIEAYKVIINNLKQATRSYYIAKGKE
ncbi:hypothetical protein CG006_02485 [Mesoplasma florum]|uniref:hypothetical protein n=1 Tax=Mesoplasma florum TaxID=2151 RepID=UPI000D02706F|nr:hypothetical protein [Mesoplasma florum]AVN63832.1 hypothetical protein CG006_02485 [Mesoplasma florum]